MNRINKLTFFFPQKGGRNHHGSITVWHRGGGNKKLYRLIDFKRTLFNIPALVLSIQSDPYRTSLIALISYKTGLLSYILAPHLLIRGSLIFSGPSSDISVGNSLPLFSLPIGSFVHNVELKPGKGAQLFRSAGTFAKIIKKDSRSAILRFHSGKFFSLSIQSMATLGVVSNPSHFNVLFRKAGQSR
jgi:large subunit ribosomal protein L2